MFIPGNKMVRRTNAMHPGDFVIHNQVGQTVPLPGWHPPGLEQFLHRRPVFSIRQPDFLSPPSPHPIPGPAPQPVRVQTFSSGPAHVNGDSQLTDFHGLPLPFQGFQVPRPDIPAQKQPVAELLDDRLSAIQHRPAKPFVKNSVADRIKLDLRWQ